MKDIRYLCVTFLAAVAAGDAFAQGPPPPTASADVVVSATKLPEDAADVAAQATVVTGAELRRRGTRTIAEALQDVTGLDTGNGSDNGSRYANIGLWGLKEFDALLVTVDGVPVGGPFNPSLSQIPIDDIDRIEIVKGPQGTLYGVSAFAGMVQIFTRQATDGGSFRAGGGSFSSWGGQLNYGLSPSPDFLLRVFGGLERSDGWQDRTRYASDRLTLSGEKKWGETALRLSLMTTRDTNYFGSPLPIDAGAAIPGFVAERNYAIQGARLDHRVYALSSSLSTPLSAGWKLENTLGWTRDEQISVRSFITATDGVTAEATGTSLKPLESTVFDDMRLVGDVQAAGRHRLVSGVALTWGRTTATGTGFDFDLSVSPVPIVPTLDQVPAGDHRSFEDRRTFWGFYINDEWTPVPFLTLTAGARYDRTSETLSVTQQEVGTPAPDFVNDSRSEGAWSGGVAGLVRILPKPAGPLETANVYAAWRSAFKPAAPNLSEAESARILEPERTYSTELGLKTRWWNQQIAFDVTLFHMIFKNLVVGIVDPNGQPALTNAGEERFQGTELELAFRPNALPGLMVAGGFAHHDATYVSFSFLTPDGELRVVDGKRLELVPRDLWNLRLVYGPEKGPGGFVALRHQNQRPLTRRNTFYTPSFFEVDAGLSWDSPRFRVSLTGRNLGDSRHPVADSEIGDSQFYIATPRRFTADLAVKF